MALVSRITGDCPSCGAKNTFGNVAVRKSYVRRGCLSCQHKDTLPLPPLRKKILYLDQFTFSRAFRRKDPIHDQKYVDIVAQIESLAHRQLLIAPYSSIHEDETHQWQGADGLTFDQLMEFIKKTSGGHEFEMASKVVRRQIISAFHRFLRNEPPDPSTKEADALPQDIHGWSDYIWIDVGGYFGNATKLASAKRSTIDQMKQILPQWIASQSTFEEMLELEWQDAAKVYLKAYVEFASLAASGNVIDAFNAPANSLVIEEMLAGSGSDASGEQRIQSISQFFKSEHFRAVPYEWISTHACAVLRDRIRSSKPTNLEKAGKVVSNTFQDIEHVATFAPYCDAIFIDNAMADLLADPRLSLTRKYGVEVFCESRWAAFEKWLRSQEANISEEHQHGLDIAYPTSIANPYEGLFPR